MIKVRPGAQGHEGTDHHHRYNPKATGNAFVGPCSIRYGVSTTIATRGPEMIASTVARVPPGFCSDTLNKSCRPNYGINGASHLLKGVTRDLFSSHRYASRRLRTLSTPTISPAR